MTDPYTVFQRYLAMKTHFLKWNYDYFEYRGRTKTTKEAFDKRPDKQQFYILSRKPNPLEVLLANLSLDPNKGLYAINHDPDTYLDYKRRMFSLSYIFENDLTELDADLESNLIVTKGSHPPLMRLFLANRISIETASFLLEHMDKQIYWKEMSKGDPLFADITMRLTKYAPFLGGKKKNLEKMFDKASESYKYILAA